jgi:GT2 family glycosyltransferase
VTPDDVAALVGSVSDKAFPRVPLLNGFCMLLNVSAVKEVGYLDEQSFPIGYGEENDLLLRLIQAGYELAIADHVYVYHKKSASFGNARRSALTARGQSLLKEKWSGYSYQYIADGIESLPCMLQLRSRLRTKLSSSKNQQLCANTGANCTTPVKDKSRTEQ